MSAGNGHTPVIGTALASCPEGGTVAILPHLPVPVLAPAPPTPAPVERPEGYRLFETGASRDTASGKLDPEAALSPLVVRRYAEYMQAHSVMPDGSRRPCDNWQKGFPRDVIMKSLWRHLMDVWLLHRGHDATRPETGEEVGLEEALCGVIFNASCYLHDLLSS